MILGLDFDNTLVSYDTLFHKVAVEAGHVPAGTPASKVAVRDYLRRQDREQVWTEMQGYVYGARMMEADTYPGVSEFLSWARDCGIELAIVSHKTRYPFLGHRYDLHAAARQWLEARLADDSGPLVRGDRIYFEETKERKLNRVGSLGCGLFVDDLPEILNSHHFPAGTTGILFDPERAHPDAGVATTVSSFAALRALVADWVPACS